MIGTQELRQAGTPQGGNFLDGTRTDDSGEEESGIILPVLKQK